MAGKRKIRVVVAEDHPAVRAGISRLLSHREDISVVGECGNGVDTVKLVMDLHPDILLLDIKMPDMDGIEVARQLMKMNSSVKILILSGYADEDLINLVMDQGVSGYLVKDDAPEKVVEVIRRIASRHNGRVKSHRLVPELSGLGGNFR